MKPFGEDWDVCETLVMHPRQDRERICRWLHIMLLKGIFGASTDIVLAAIRREFIEQEVGKPFLRPDLNQFPSDKIEAILQKHGKDPGVSKGFIDSLLTRNTRRSRLLAYWHCSLQIWTTKTEISTKITCIRPGTAFLTWHT